MRKGRTMEDKDQVQEQDQQEEAPAADPAPPAPEPSAREAAVDAALAKWVSGLRGGPVARSTEAWNAVQGALPALKECILGID